MSYNVSFQDEGQQALLRDYQIQTQAFQDEFQNSFPAQVELDLRVVQAVQAKDISKIPTPFLPEDVKNALCFNNNMAHHTYFNDIETQCLKNTHVQGIEIPVQNTRNQKKETLRISTHSLIPKPASETDIRNPTLKIEVIGTKFFGLVKSSKTLAKGSASAVSPIIEEIIQGYDPSWRYNVVEHVSIENAKAVARKARAAAAAKEAAPLQIASSNDDAKDNSQVPSSNPAEPATDSKQPTPSEVADNS